MGDVIRLHAVELNTQRPLPQQRALIASKLELALNRPLNAKHYEGADLPNQAAHLLWGITKAHAFIDGNKRTAWITTQYFLDLNGFLLDQAYEDAFPVVIGIAENHLSVAEVDAWIRRNLIQIQPERSTGHSLPPRRHAWREQSNRPS